MTSEEARTLISAKCDLFKERLLGKNTAYGNSALDPVRIFSQADPIEQLKVRIDDKLSRIKRGQAAGEDVKFDLVGYLILLIIAEEERDKPEEYPFPEGPVSPTIEASPKLMIHVPPGKDPKEVEESFRRLLDVTCEPAGSPGCSCGQCFGKVHTVGPEDFPGTDY